MSITTATKLPHAAGPAALEGKRILLAESDSNHVLAVDTALTEAGADVTVARTLQTARAAVRGKAFDAAVVGLSLRGGRGTKVVDALRRSAPPCLAVMVSARRHPAVVTELLGAAAVDVLFSPVPRGEIVDAVRRAVDATAMLRRRFEAASASYAAEGTGLRRGPGHLSVVSPPMSKSNIDVDGAVTALAKDARLSPRESVVLRYIALGYRYQDIGEALAISPRTVKMHAANLRRKAGASSRYELLRLMFTS